MHGLWAFAVLSTGWNLPVPLIVYFNYLFGLPANSWSPHNLPNYFGPFLNVTDHGVTGIWGGWWHQHMRIMVSAPGLAVADWLDLTEERLLREEATDRRVLLFNCRYVLQVVSAFFFSGITHMGVVPPLAPGAMGLRLRIAGFFWLQAVAVIFERLLTLSLGNPDGRYSNHGGSSQIAKQYIIRIIRLLWALTWLCLTLPLLERPFNQLGWWKVWPPPGLPLKLRYYVHGEWIP